VISRQRLAAFFLSVLVGACFFLAPAAALAQSSLTGQWTKLTNLPFVPIHNILLPDGKVMIWGKDLRQGLWDPLTQTVSVLPNPGYDLFCAGHTYLGDGRLFIPGGHIQDYAGLANASIYNPATNTWAAVPDMHAGRWYPTATTLANGDVVVIGGQIDTIRGLNSVPEVYQAATNTWRELTNAPLNQDLYPMMLLAPNGKVIEAGPTPLTRWLDPSGTGQWSIVGWRKHEASKQYGSAVMYDEGKALLVGGGDPPTATAEVIDLNVPAPEWRVVAPMLNARRHMHATLLPDGTVLATGGTYGPGSNNPNTPVFAAELWNPATETWTTMASASVPRLYHSSALLLPDGRVLITGGDESDGGTNYPDVEVYSPPYLFKGKRPTMSGVPASIGWGQQFSVQSPDAAGIAKVTLIRLAATTHSFDQSQRLNTLQFTPRAGVSGMLDITAPAHGNVAPPGLYMLFIVNGKGVPSMGSVVKVGAATTPPPPAPAPAPALSSLSPSSATAGGPAFTLTVNGSNFVTGAAVRWNGAPRATTFVSSSQVKGTITSADIAAAGTAQVSVANPDGAVSGTLSFTIAAGPAVPMYSLTVARDGNAASRGTVTSNPAGIDCGDTCSASFAKDGTVTLTASTRGNAVFAGWSGACTGTGACTLTMDGNKSVTATFNRR
jgi:hypothetical protein